MSPSQPSIPTRPSLLARLRSAESADGWVEFYRLYGDLLRRFALKAGLTESEAEEVVQETAIGVARNLPGFRYDPATCSFKTWMLNLAQWRVIDALRRRGPASVDRDGGGGLLYRRVESTETDDGSASAAIERFADPRMPDFGAEWDADWERNLWQIALDRVRQTIDPKQYQMFDRYVLKEETARDVARRFGVSVARIYLTKHRVSARLSKELALLEREAQGRG